MRTHPIVAADLQYLGQERLPYSAAFDDVYHARAGALDQARHVFLGGNGLPARWGARARFVILETGFGLGNNFLATWQAWRDDPRRCDRLYFLSVEKHPLRRDDLRQAHAASVLAPLADQLVAQWPPLTPNIHALSFEQGRVQLLLALGDVHDLLGQWVAQVDAFFLDGFSPAKNPQMWQPHLFKRMARLAAPEATAATWSTARLVRDGLEGAGFAVSRAPGFAHKRDMLVAHHAPRIRPASPPGGWRESRCEPRALIVGAGLAGAAAARALGDQGWAVRVLDAAALAAQGASGNPAGVFHGVVHAQDGPYTRLLRAAALAAQRDISAAVAGGRVPGACEGLLRLDPIENESACERLQRLGLPPDYVRWLPREEAASLSGLPLPRGAWHFAHAGWVDPGAYVRELLRGPGIELCASMTVARIERHAGQWWALDSQGRALGHAPVMVLANAHAAPALAAPHMEAAGIRLWRSRGQITWLPAQAGLSVPRLPVAGQGYVLGLEGGGVLCGATNDPDDLHPDPRAQDHLRNLEQAVALGAVDIGHKLSALASCAQGRVAWRTFSMDKLPIIGALSSTGTAQAPGAVRRDQPRFIERERDDDGGLYVFSALGSRGISWAHLGAQVLASWITGSPCPVEADLRDALDPARFAARRAREQMHIA